MGGFNRALAIDQATAKLTGLGHSTTEVKSIMDNALASVKGTAFGLGDAAGVAASLVASGIAPGKQLESTLRTVADTASIAGISMNDMGAIFGSVAARGKLQGDDMMQLTSRGVPVLQMLSKQLGVSSSDISNMVSKGEIDFATFAAAMEANPGRRGHRVRADLHRLTPERPGCPRTPRRTVHPARAPRADRHHRHHHGGP